MNKAVFLHTEFTEAGIIELGEMPVPGTPVELLDKKLGSLGYSVENYSPGGCISVADIVRHHILPEDLNGKPTFKNYHLPEGYDCVVVYDEGQAMSLNIAPDTQVTVIALRNVCKVLWPNIDSHDLDAMVYSIGLDIGDGRWARDQVMGKHGADSKLQHMLIVTNYITMHVRQRGTELENWLGLATIQPAVTTEVIEYEEQQ